ncbi:hypothetical protein PHYSODRAFT_300849 [Phytophthora sojae]|uniref:Amino acid permease/ SLC12A domain-containing protein n=1 Tax=Phytophthora sojae (strain P6497) TaxID=1094619 RepID=G4ZG92_PHYSP|nr:hypothetical protein PHYSODRAFT_300849 [Phytophthora sojae]EGZ17995.1 hypothetical protein PHYSODRAFT_300849 [Phytophthora sojae]|eukprot:XP_009527053.1 hypothetical protein PHYSODRAFT_300849 [Phytophthora sojae]
MIPDENVLHKLRVEINVVSATKVLPAAPPSSSPDSRPPNATTVGPGAEIAPVRYKPGKLNLFMLGITIVMGGQYADWNEGLHSGLYSFIIAYFLIAIGYLLLCCCTAEINGALPFSGGAYGLARCTLGFYPAFMIGCCDTTEYIVYTSASVISLTELVLEAVPGLKPYQPLVWGLFYVVALAIVIRGGRAFWVVNFTLGGLTLLFLAIYCFGSLPYVSFKLYATDPEMKFVAGFRGFMLGLPHAAWLFVGIEALSLDCDQTDTPKKIIPVVQLFCIATAFVIGVMVLFVTVSLPPGLAVVANTKVLFDLGFSLMFKIPYHYAAFLSLPAAFATAFGFMWAYGKLIAAMSTSRLLLPFCAKTTARSNTPYNALLFGSAWSYALCLLVYVVPQVGESFTGVCMLSAAMSYSGQCVGYIALKRNYKNIKSSEFRSPFGIAGAFCSLLVWILMAISLLTVHDDGGIDAMGFTIVVILFTVFLLLLRSQAPDFFSAGKQDHVSGSRDEIQHQEGGGQPAAPTPQAEQREQ